jgi:hypothetical protein
MVVDKEMFNEFGAKTRDFAGNGGDCSTVNETALAYRFNIRTVHYQTIRRDQKYALNVLLLYLRIGSYMFRQESAIVLLLRHSIGFTLHDKLYILILYLLHILDIPPIRFVFQVTQEDLISSLIMAGYCRNA